MCILKGLGRLVESFVFMLLAQVVMLEASPLAQSLGSLSGHVISNSLLKTCTARHSLLVLSSYLTFCKNHVIQNSGKAFL